LCAAEVFGDGARELARLRFERFGELKGEIGRIVAVLGVARALDAR
jgi:hypothetical protein